MSAELRKMVADLRSELADAKKPQYPANAKPSDVFGSQGPTVRKGENSLSSRPVRFLTMLGLASGRIPSESAKIEMEALSSYHKSLSETDGGLSAPKDFNSAIYWPGSFGYFPDKMADHPGSRQLKSMMAASAPPDPEQVAWIAQRISHYQKSDNQDVVEAAVRDAVQRHKAPLTGAQSWLDSSLMGSMVAPPVQGELIPLMRNQSMLDRAGCQQYPLPPQGRAVWPRQSSASNAYWITENTNITTSQLGTGQMAMEAKKLGIGIVVPNDLFKFAGPAADALIMADSAKSLALTMDAAGLYGSGVGQPRGLNKYTNTNELIDYASLTNPAPIGVSANGNAIQPQDAEYMIGQIEDRNFDVDKGYKWIMRGSMWRRLNAVRADSVTADDEAGPFVTALTRLLSDKIASNWSGYEVIRSSQVLGNLTKGTGTNLSQVWGGMWNECVMGLYGAIEFARGFGDGTFLADQTIIRGIMYGDVSFRYPGAFTVYNSLLNRQPN